MTLLNQTVVDCYWIPTKQVSPEHATTPRGHGKTTRNSNQLFHVWFLHNQSILARNLITGEFCHGKQLQYKAYGHKVEQIHPKKLPSVRILLYNSKNLKLESLVNADRRARSFRVVVLMISTTMFREVFARD